MAKKRTSKTTPKSKTTRRKPGDRDWTPEQKNAHSSRMREMHAARKRAEELSEVKKGVGIVDLTLGMLIDRLEKLVKSGTKKSTRVIFLESCANKPDISVMRRFEDGNVVEEVLFQ